MSPTGAATTTTAISADEKVLAKQEESPHQLQFVPANITHNGPANVQSYFTQFVFHDAERGCLRASLRGRPLDGKVVSLPDGVSAFVLQTGRDDGLRSDDHKRTLRVVKACKDMTVWNYDKVPSKDDKFNQALGWLDMAEILHGSDSRHKSS